MNFIDETVFLGDSPAPLLRKFTFQLLGMPCAGARMLCQLNEKTFCFGESLWFAQRQASQLLVCLAEPYMA